MKRLRGEEGIALVMVLVLAAIALAIMAALVFMLTESTQVSGIQKRYKTSREAGRGGADLIFQTIDQRTPTYEANWQTAMALLGANRTTPNTCAGTDRLGMAFTGFQTKLHVASTAWSGCDSSPAIDPGTTSSYDWSFQVGSGANTYNVYAKIVSTVEGNTVGTGAALNKWGVTGAGSSGGVVSAMSIPYVYTIQVLTQNAGNPVEKSKYSIMYLW